MLTQEQENLIHPAAVKFAIEHYQDKIFPKGSVMLIAAENFADNNAVLSNTSQIASYQLVVDCFLSKVEKILRLLRNEPAPRVMRS